VLLEFCEWLATTEWSIALHESFYMYPWVESSHVLLITVFVGILTFIDLRMLGLVFKDVPISQLTSKLLPWSITGFVLIVITGLLLFYAIPVRTYQSIFFRIKVIVLIAAMVNALWFHFKIQNTEWDNDPIPPKRVRIVALVSLASWMTVIVTGRMIAYNWFDCDRQPQSSFINWATSCDVEAL
jgi:hypothetical protein